MKRLTIYTEAAYTVGLIMLTFGTALMTAGNFGISMVVAPAYILHLKLSQLCPFFSFGVAEYLLQAVIIILMMLILKRVRIIYLLTFIHTAVYGIFLDLSMAVMPEITNNAYFVRGAVYLCGVLLCTSSLALLFKSYLPLAAYEAFVKNISQRFNFKLFTLKTVFDCIFCVIAVVLSLIFFGEIKGVGVGTIICAMFYGTTINLFTKLFNKIFVFKDRFSFKIFKESEGK
ncbi:MAG: hypothetical protein IJD00_01450 [Clostridia bacterium]|nr:hypothetical protein [Clostridia bacterium]